LSSRYLPPAQVGARQNDIRITNNAVTGTEKTIIYSKASPFYHFALVPNINTILCRNVKLSCDIEKNYWF